MLIWQAIAHIHNSYSSLGQTMLHQTPKNDGSLGHGKRSPQKKATVTKSNGLDLLSRADFLYLLPPVCSAHNRLDLGSGQKYEGLRCVLPAHIHAAPSLP